MEKALRQLHEESETVNELQNELKTMTGLNNELAKSGQEARLLLAQRDETCVMLQVSYFCGFVITNLGYICLYCLYT